MPTSRAAANGYVTWASPGRLDSRQRFNVTAHGHDTKLLPICSYRVSDYPDDDEEKKELGQQDLFSLNYHEFDGSDALVRCQSTYLRNQESLEALNKVQSHPTVSQLDSLLYIKKHAQGSL